MAHKYIFEDVSPAGTFSPSFLGEAPKRAQALPVGDDRSAARPTGKDNFDTHVTGNIDRLGDGAISFAGTSDPISLKKAAVLASVGIHAAFDSRAKDTAWNTLDDAEVKPAAMRLDAGFEQKVFEATAGIRKAMHEMTLDQLESRVGNDRDVHAALMAFWTGQGHTEGEIMELQDPTRRIAAANEYAAALHQQRDGLTA